MRDILSAFKHSKLSRLMKFEQRRTAFKYFKPESQERMDGFAKATEQYKHVIKKRILVPKYRLRPFTQRYLPNEWAEFITRGNAFHIVLTSYFFMHMLYEISQQRIRTEHTLLEHLHPDEIQDPYVGMKYNLFNNHLNWDDPDSDNLFNPYPYPE